jgi:hypothetical protein
MKNFLLFDGFRGIFYASRKQLDRYADLTFCNR